MIITLRSDRIEAEINTMGGAIESIRNIADNEEHYWQYDDKVWPRRTSICFPICGKLPDGKYIHEGREYEMPMHGFLREKDMQVISCADSVLVLGFESDDSTRKIYPFDFYFELTTRAVGYTLEVTYTIRNTGGTDMFYSTGSHYTYKLPANERDCFYYFSKPQNAGRFLPENGIFVAKSHDIFHGTGRLSMDGLFEPPSVIMDLSEVDSEYIGIGTDNHVFTKVKEKGFPYVVLWAKTQEDCPFACIEYWAGMAEFIGNDGEISHKKGIQCLAPNREQSFRQIIDIEVKE